MSDVVTHPLWRPFDPGGIAARAASRIGRRQIDVPGIVAPRDWSSEFAAVHDLLVDALGQAVVSIEHVGSTAVPGLCAKPILDVDLTVADSRAESMYLPMLQLAGFRLIAREAEWEEHRFLTLSVPNTNLHVFSPGAVEPRRHLAFRDWLSTHRDDRVAYERSKRAASASATHAGRSYNERKAAVAYEIYERIFLADHRHRHIAHPLRDPA